MSKRRKLQARIESLAEIKSIMNSMKNLALTEIHKLQRYQEQQHNVVQLSRRALNDIQSSLVDKSPAAYQSESAPPLYLLFGSERGFCGSYNRKLLDLLAERLDPALPAPVVGIGSRLAAPLQALCPHAVTLNGAGAADEAAQVLVQALNAINKIRATDKNRCVQIIHYPADQHSARCEPLLPPTPPQLDSPPLTNLPAAELLPQLLEHHLFALSHHWLYTSLLTENQQRIQHLESAGQSLNDKLEQLAKQRNALRQEEIIEEIEVILLSADVVENSTFGYHET